MTTQQLKSACFLIKAPASKGTAYLVGPKTLATCHHVIESAGIGGEVSVLHGKNPMSAKVTKANPFTDCAILELSEPLPGLRPLLIAGRSEERAQWDGYGFPSLSAASGLPYFGLVLDPESEDDIARPMMTLYSDMLAAGMAAPVHGLSGGPVSVNGAVVGHFSRVLGTPGAAGQPALGVIYAARTANVLALLDQSPAIEVAEAPPVVNIVDLIPQLKPGEFHAFISYRSSDQRFAKLLYERLNGIGLRVFLDQRELVPGEELAGRLHEALSKSGCGIVLVSRGWLDSQWCLEEGNTLVARALNERSCFRLIPLRLENIEMPSMFAGPLWLDFAGESTLGGRKLEQIIYGILGRPMPAENSAENKVQITLTDATDEAMRRVDGVVRDPTRFRSFLDFLRRSGLPEAAPRLRAADALIGAGRMNAALEILPPAEQSLGARQLRALALSKQGKDDEALDLLEPLFNNGAVDAETGGILGGIYKRIWQTTGTRLYLIKSFDTYQVTYAATGDAYAGVNLASLALLLDRSEESRRTAIAIRDKLGALPEAKLDHWLRATLAETLLVLGNFEHARFWYEKAVARSVTRPQNIAVMRRQARLLLPKLGREANALDDSLPVPRVVMFSGHMTDATGRAIPRFPETKAEAVRHRIHQWLVENGGAVHGVCSAARGADLLFLEEVLALRGTATVFLPFPPEDFKKTSVGQGWDARFDAALENDRVEVQPPLFQTLPPEGEQPAAFEACNEAIINDGKKFAKLFDDNDPVLLTVWNGNLGDASGGTAHAVTLWQQRGRRLKNIDISLL